MLSIGRPSVFDAVTLQKLEEAFANDATDVQACFLANISPASLYNYQKEHPDFLERKKALKGMTAYQAKINIKNKVIDGDVAISQWYVERKEKNEGFSTRTELTAGDGKDFPTPILATAYVSDDNSHKEDNKPQEENQSNTGGNVSEQDNLNPSVLDSLIPERQDTNIDLSGSSEHSPS
jgi:hypothetical protein